VEDYDQVEEFDYDPGDDGHYGEEAEEELDETYDAFDEGYDDPEEGYFAEEYYGDGFFGEVQIEDPDGLLEADPIPEELDVTTNLEEGYYNDRGSSASPPGLSRNQATVASSVSTRHSTEYDSEGSRIPDLLNREDQCLNSSGSKADDTSKASDTSSKDSELETKSANMTRDKTPQVTWQRNIHNTTYTEDLSPHTIGQAYEVGGSTGRYIFRTLFDSGSTSDTIKKSALPRGAKLIPLPRGEGVQTTGGPTQVTHYVILDTIVFPEFSPTQYLKERKMMVFDSPTVRYDIIVGRKTLAEMGLSLDFKDRKMRWLDRSVPFHPKDWFTDKEAMQQVLKTPPTAVLKAEAMDAYADSLFHEIKAAKYEKADLDAHVKTLKHLTDLQQQQLLAVFKKHEPLFNGKVGKFPREVHLDVDPEAGPYHHPRPYPVNHANMDVLKNELDRQETLGIISRVYEPTAWCMPMFPREKKDGTIRTIHDFRWLNRATIHDFRWLNRAIRRRIHAMPKIEDLLFSICEYKYLTKIDISMQYYAFWLDEESSWYCVFSRPLESIS